MAKTNWPVKTLGDICELQRGHDLPTPKRREGKVPILGSTGITGFHDVALYAGPGVAIGRSGFIGGAQYCDTPYWPLNTCLFIKDFFGNEPRWVYYFLKSIDFSKYNSGTTQPSLNRNNLGNIPVVTPPLVEQKRIVALLDAANARVTELTACYEQARTEANNLFTSALRDALAPSDSWPVKRLGDLCLFVRGPFGGSLKKSVFVSTGHAVYEQQHAIYGKFDKFRYFVSASKFQEMKRFEVFPGDILMSCSGTIGKTVIVPVGAPAGIINQALLKLSCSEKLNNQYLCVWMRSIYFQEAVFASVVGVALQNVASVAILKNIPISLPPTEQQKQIVAQLDLMRAKTSEMVSAYDAKLQAAKDLRQSILEAAFAGDL